MPFLVCIVLALEVFKKMLGVEGIVEVWQREKWKLQRTECCNGCGEPA